MPPDDEIIPADGFWRIKDIFGGPFYFPYMMGLGQGNRAAPPSWIQLSAVLVNVYKQLNLGSMITDPITAKIIHTMGTLFVDGTDLYTWLERGGVESSSVGAGALELSAQHDQWCTQTGEMLLVSPQL